MDRFNRKAKMMDGSLPVLIISSDPSFNSYATYTGFKDVKVLKRNFTSTDIEFVISKLPRNRFSNAGMS